MPQPPLTIKITGVGPIQDRLHKFMLVTENKVKLYDRIGIQVISWIHKNFRAQGLEHPWKALRPSTLFGKRMAGKDAKPLSGLEKWASYRTSARNVVIGFPDESPAKYQHYGTPGPYKIRPRNKKALKFFALPMAGKTILQKRGTIAKGVTKKGMPRVGMVKGDKQSVAFAMVVTHPGLPPRPMLPSQTKGGEIAAAVIEDMFKEAAGG